MGGGTSGAGAARKAREGGSARARSEARGPVGAVERSVGVRFDRSQVDRDNGYKLVVVDTAKLDAALGKDVSFHVGPGGVGPSAIAGRYQEAQRFLARARQENLPFHAPGMFLDRQGQPSVKDGRHRWAALRDEGHARLVVAVPRHQVDRWNRRFGP